MNNVVNVAIGYTPFFLNFGDHPIVPSILLCGGDVSSHVEAVQTMVDQMKTALEEAQANLSITANRAKAYADASRRAETFEVGNEVVLAMRHLHINEHLPVKLRRRWIGPFSITKVISPVAYRLDLPPTLGIHPYLSSLKFEEISPIRGDRKGGAPTFTRCGRWQCCVVLQLAVLYVVL